MKGRDTIKIDQYDRLIMQELEKNARENFHVIGKQVGLSPESIVYRINRLKKLGIIQRMFAEPNFSKLGFTTYRLYLQMENTTEKEEKAFLKYISTNKHVYWHATCEGEWDYIVRYALPNEHAFKEELDEMLLRFGVYVKAKSIAITTFQTYLPITYFTETARGKTKSKHSTPKTIEILDAIDRTILSFLVEDARAKSVAIARHLSISPDAVQYRIRRLIKEGVISFFTTWFDRRKLGYEYYKVLLWFQYTNKEAEENIIHYCEQHPSVVFINKVLGNWDLEVDFDAKNSAHIHELIKELKNKFAGQIRDHAVLTILEDAVVNPLKR